MILAALDPRGSYVGLCIAEDNPPRVLFIGTIRLTTYENTGEPDHADGSPSLRAVVTPSRQDYVIDEIVRLCRDYGAKMVVAEKPSRAFAVDFATGLNDTLRLTYVETPTINARTAPPLEGWPAAKREAIPDAPEWQTGDYVGTRAVGWILAKYLGCAAPVDPPRAPDAPPPPIDPPRAPTPIDDPPPEFPPPSDAPRSMAVDPGSRYLAWAVVEGTTPPLTAVDTGSKDFEWSPTACDFLAEQMVGIMTRAGVTTLYLEHIAHARITGNAARATSVANAMLRTAWVEAVIRARVIAAGFKVELVTHGAWKDRVVGRTERAPSTPTAARKALKAKRALVASLQADLEERPTKSVARLLAAAKAEIAALEGSAEAAKKERRSFNKAKYTDAHSKILAASYSNLDEFDLDEHERDALGLALYAVLPAQPDEKSKSPKRAPRHRAPGEKRLRDHAKRDEERARLRAERAAKGCTCAKRHVRTCVLFQAKEYVKHAQA